MIKSKLEVNCFMLVPTCYLTYMLASYSSTLIATRQSAAIFMRFCGYNSNNSEHRLELRCCKSTYTWLVCYHISIESTV